METESCNNLRPMNCEVNQLSQPDGSSIFMQGDTCVVAGIYGPIESKLQKVMYDKAHVEVFVSPLKGPPSIEDRTKELFIKETCESTLIVALHPGTAISINVQELEDAGGLLACTINSACMALINSGLSMKFTVAAVNCMIEMETGNIIIDPDISQLKDAKATFTFAFDSINKGLVCCHTTGKFSEKELMEAIDKCKETSVHIFDFYREVVKKYAYCISQ